MDVDAPSTLVVIFFMIILSCTIVAIASSEAINHVMIPFSGSHEPENPHHSSSVEPHFVAMMDISPFKCEVSLHFARLNTRRVY